MADFARWVVAAEPALPWAAGEFTAAYSDNRKDGNRAALESSPIWPVLEVIVAKGGDHWRGTASEPLAAMNSEIDGSGTESRTQRRDGWPKQANTLLTALSRIAPNLRAIGYLVSIETKGRSKSKTIKINAPTAQEEVCDSSRVSTASTANGPDGAENEDGAGDGRVIDGRSAQLDHPQESAALDAKNAVTGDAGDQLRSFSWGEVGVIE